jgi:hypothetical protein
MYLFVRDIMRRSLNKLLRTPFTAGDSSFSLEETILPIKLLSTSTLLSLKETTVGMCVLSLR